MGDGVTVTSGDSPKLDVSVKDGELVASEKKEDKPEDKTAPEDAAEDDSDNDGGEE